MKIEVNPLPRAKTPHPAEWRSELSARSATAEFFRGNRRSITSLGQGRAGFGLHCANIRCVDGAIRSNIGPEIAGSDDRARLRFRLTDIPGIHRAAGRWYPHKGCSLAPLHCPWSSRRLRPTRVTMKRLSVCDAGEVNRGGVAAHDRTARHAARSRGNGGANDRYRIGEGNDDLVIGSGALSVAALDSRCPAQRQSDIKVTRRSMCFA